MQVSILKGIYASKYGEFRTALPRNLVPVPTDTGLSKGYLRPAEGIVETGTGPGMGRGGIVWNGVLYRVMGSKLVSVDATGAISELGTVAGTGRVTMDYSFDRLGIAAGGNLYYWNDKVLTQVTDADLGNVVDMRWVAGYFLTTDGTSLVVTELNDPGAVSPLKYGSSETDPDPILAVDELRNEVYAFGRYTIEVFQNVGGSGFPFQVIEGAQVPRGVIGTHAYDNFLNSFAFLGSGRKEAPAVYLMTAGDTQKISTQEIDQLLSAYTEAQLSTALVETVVSRNHDFLLVHLPDQCLVFDAKATQAVGEQVWHTRDSGKLEKSAYRARGWVWWADGWHVEDTESPVLGRMEEGIASHFDTAVGFDVSTPIVYNGGNGAVIHELELVGLPGRVLSGADPRVWTSYSPDGESWGMERAISAGKQGERLKRLVWRTQGTVENYRMQRFRWFSDVHMSIARLEMQVEPLFTRPGHG